ncbi:MAG: hypothetical protein RL095_53 [Verrucomicrobiota bacterium]|jgi:phosphatidate cytidylyltransferase
MTFFDFQSAFDFPLVKQLLIAVGALILAAPLLTETLFRMGRVGADLRREIQVRIATWAVLALLIFGGVLGGRLPMVLLCLLLALLCWREFARITGVFREGLLSAAVVLGIAWMHFAALDHWYALFLALPPLCVATLCVLALTADQPKGYIQRVALSCFGLLLIGGCFAHLAYLVNDPRGRALALSFFAIAAIQDVGAFCVGKACGRRKLAPVTSPGKTLEGALGGTLLAGIFGLYALHQIFPSASLAGLAWIAASLPILALLGDLVLGSIKRDVGVKDAGTLLPGHGGVLDRFNSLLLISPVAFHLLRYLYELAASHGGRLISG